MPKFYPLIKRSLHILWKGWIVKFALNFSQPFLYITAMGAGIGSYIHEMNGVSYLTYVATGIVASIPMYEAVFSCTYDVFVRMHYQKIYQSMLTTPIGIKEIVIGEVLSAVIKSLLYSSGVILILVLVGLINSWMAPVALLPIALLALIFALLSLSVTAIVPFIDYFNFYTLLFITPAYLFSGVFFPISTLPDWAQLLIWLNPVYHGGALCRGFLLGTLPDQWIYHFLVLFAMIGVLALLPERLLYRRIIQ